MSFEGFRGGDSRLRMGIRRDIRMFRGRRFLRCLRADAVRSPVIRLTVTVGQPRLWHHVFDIPRFRVWYNCNGVFQDMKLWGHRVVLAGSVERLGQDRAFPWLLSPVIEEPCRGREAWSHFRHI